MTFQVIAEAAAKRDWNEAVDWYEEREPGVGLRGDVDRQEVTLRPLCWITAGERQ